jgi:bisphosphoglycerate-dependent phosphoglycerate mutase
MPPEKAPVRWVDVRLTEQGREEAARGGELLKESGILPDVLHTSLLSRAVLFHSLCPWRSRISV